MQKVENGMTREESIDFYKTHAQRLYGTSLRITGDSALAEEIMQDTILKFITSGVRTGDEGQTGAWLSRTCIRKSIDALRKRRREKLFLDEYSAEAESRTSDETSDEVPESGITAVELRKALEELPGQQRLILDLVLLEGLDYEEISQMTGTREGTLRTRFSRAKEHLAKILKHHRI